MKNKKTAFRSEPAEDAMLHVVVESYVTPGDGPMVFAGSLPECREYVLKLARSFEEWGPVVGTPVHTTGVAVLTIQTGNLKEKYRD